MIAFSLFMAVLDTFAGEFGTRGTSLLFVLPAFGASIIGLKRGLRLLISVYDTIRWYKKMPSRIHIFGSLYFVSSNVIIFYATLYEIVTFDDIAVIVVALASPILPVVKTQGVVFSSSDLEPDEDETQSQLDPL